MMIKFWRKQRSTETEEQAKGVIIDAEHLKVIRSIGEGQYGFVKQGEWTQENDKKKQVAIKFLKESSMQLMSDLVKEATTMQTLQHENIVMFYGISAIDNQLQLVTEFAPMGSLLDNLNNAKSEIRQVSVLTRFAVQIAAGMQYLSSRNRVHRDLAARNILVFHNELVKIADFGLTRTMKNSGNLELTMGRRMPLAWCSPEILREHLYSLASDVWSYGITLWEMYSFGAVPWEKMDARGIIQIYSTVPLRMLEKPRACPDGLYEVMKSCWELEPQRRPSFQELCKKIDELHPKHVITRTSRNPSANEDLLNFQEKDVITVIRETTLDLWLGQHENGQIGLFPKKYTRSYKKRFKKRGKSFDAETLPHVHPGTVRYGAQVQMVEGTEDRVDDEGDEPLPRRVTNYLPMDRAIREEPAEAAPDPDQDEYVSIHRNNPDGFPIPHGFPVFPINDGQLTQTDAVSIAGNSSRPEAGASRFVPTSHVVPTERPTPTDAVSIAGNSPRPVAGVSRSVPTSQLVPTDGPTVTDAVSIPRYSVPPRREIGASRSVPTSHLNSADERRPNPPDDAPTVATRNGAPSWATLPRQTPPEIPARADLLDRKAPNGEGAVPESRERAGSDGGKRKAPVPLPRTKTATPRATPRSRPMSQEGEPRMAQATPKEQGPAREPPVKTGPSDDSNPVAENALPGDPTNGSAAGEDESVYERPWVEFPNPLYELHNRSAAGDPQPVYTQPREHVGATLPGNHIYELPNRPQDHAAAGHIYEQPDRNSDYATPMRSNGHKPTSPPLPPKDILSRDALAASGLPEPLRPIPLSPTSPTEAGGFRFACGNAPNMTSAPTPFGAASSPMAEDFYDKPLVLPPPPMIPDETLHRPPPMDPFGPPGFIGNVDSELGGMTLDFRRAHSGYVPDEGTEPQDTHPSLSEEQEDCVREVRAVWSAADIDWCCAALMGCHGDVARVVEMAKVEQVQVITTQDKERCERTLKHCNWNVDRAVNWIFDSGE